MVSHGVTFAMSQHRIITKQLATWWKHQLLVPRRNFYHLGGFFEKFQRISAKITQKKKTFKSKLFFSSVVRYSICGLENGA